MRNWQGDSQREQGWWQGNRTRWHSWLEEEVLRISSDGTLIVGTIEERRREVERKKRKMMKDKEKKEKEYPHVIKVR
jgi:hypothetical protein